MTTRSLASSPTGSLAIGLITTFLLISITQLSDAAYYGKLIGKLSELNHGVSGEVYAVDRRTLFIKDFTYDGEGPAAYFYAGNSKGPVTNGFRLRDERGSADVLKAYRKKDITLTLPDDKSLNNIKWFSVWCDEFSVNFGDVRIPRGFDYPKPQKLKALHGIHGVNSEPVVIVDAQTLLIPSFSYDGEAPDAKFWVGAGPTPSPQGIRIPDENGKEQPLRRYDHKTIVLTLPGDLTVHQLGHFGVWCEAFAVDFGHVQIPQSLNIPPSLKMLGVSPQSKLNCEVLEDSLAFEVRWAVAGDSIVVQLVAKLNAGQYMSFGISGNMEKSVMIGGDVVVAWVDKQTLQGYAIDYFLDAKSQCSGHRGSCPDNRILENTGSVRLLNAAMVNGYSIVTYQRPLKASDELDRPIVTNGSQAIIWAIGPLNERQEVSFHSIYLKNDKFIEFGRPPAWNCPMPDQDQISSYGDTSETASNNQQLAVITRRPQRPATPAPAPTNDAWEIPPIQCYEPEDGIFYAQMGPTGGKHGYPAITGHVGWGISWYINGLLIPEINVVRGKKYTFVVEGGLDPDIPARYHPFYITDDPVGGYQHKTPEEKAKVKLFAGVRRQRGIMRPTGVGRLCNWVPDQNQPPSDEFASFGAYQRTLTLECDHGEPGIVEWIPDENTPDTVYYQCFTHRYLGWKINVHDSCDITEGSASETREVYAEFKGEEPGKQDLEFSSSIPVASKVTPPAEFLHQQHVHHHHPQYGHRYLSHSTTNPGKLSASHHSQLLTKANNNYDRFQLSSFENPHDSRSSHSNVANAISPHRSYEPRPKNSYHMHSDQGALQQQQQQHRSSATFHEQSSPHVGHTQFMEHAREIPQTTNQQLSNLVTDNQQPLSHGTKLSYPTASTQLPYSRAPNHYATNYNHIRYQLLPHRYHQPEQRTQLMIIKRPVVIRRPMLQTLQASLLSALSLPLSLPLPLLQPKTIFIQDRKKIFRLPGTTIKMIPDKVVSAASANLPIEKFTKVDPKQQQVKQKAKLESKMSEAAPVDLSDDLIESIKYMKPARNTGFDPDSIVIEGGFKPIIRNIDRSSDIAQRRISGMTQQQEIFRKNSDYGLIEEFSPVFVPSLPMTTSQRIDNGRKRKKKIPLNRNGGYAHRFEDIDDMEMAADRFRSYYLPPVTSVRSDKVATPSPNVLIAYDGKRLTDSGLARSIPLIEHHSKDTLTSEILSKTPQSGKFQGELPPPISSESRTNNSSYGRKYHPSTTDLNPELFPRTNTKLTLVERSKRSSIEDRTMSSVDFQHYSWTDQQHHHRNNHDHQLHDHISATPVSAGKVLLGNLGYVVIITITYLVI